MLRAMRRSFESLERKLNESRRGRDGKRILAELVKLTRDRHAKYGGTLFHLEPNIKDCPGGLRDVHVCSWMSGSWRARGTRACGRRSMSEEFQEAVEFLTSVRCFLH